jgi:hypothetical protein
MRMVSITFKAGEECFIRSSFLYFIKIYNLSVIKNIRKKVILLGIFIDKLDEYLRRRFIIIGNYNILYNGILLF